MPLRKYNQFQRMQRSLYSQKSKSVSSTKRNLYHFNNVVHTNIRYWIITNTILIIMFYNCHVAKSFVINHGLMLKQITRTCRYRKDTYKKITSLSSTNLGSSSTFSATPINRSSRSYDDDKNKIQQQHIQYNISLPTDLYKPYYQLYYNDVYEVPLPPKHRFPMSKYKQVRERIQNILLSQNETENVQFNFKVSPLVTNNDLVTTHCEKYVDRYMVGDLMDQELRNVGFPWSLEGVNRSLSSTGGTVAAALSVCYAKREQMMKVRNDYDDGSCINGNKKYGALFAAHIAGGTHHAFKDRGEGFSVFSDIAVAANVVLRDFPDVVSRILIIDLDGKFNVIIVCVFNITSFR